MKILAIETSCDETAVCLLEVHGEFPNVSFTVLGNALYSQIDVHREYGGVFPTLAKREHSKNLVPLLYKALEQAGKAESGIQNTESGENTTKQHLSSSISSQDSTFKILNSILEREPELQKQFLEHVTGITPPDIDAIAVTHAPGLEPALWVGINFAKALSHLWEVPIVPVNHMEGHLFSALVSAERNPKSQIKNSKQTSRTIYNISHFQFPAIALLVSGGHTELVHMPDWFSYEVIGHTRDDAVGEAFDKTARMLCLPYPGGPEISKLAAYARTHDITAPITLPRPMHDADNFDFSYSGLKTAVLYHLKAHPEPTKEQKAGLARELEDAIVDTLIGKSTRAISHYGTYTLALGGGVAANKTLRAALAEAVDSTGAELHTCPPELATDNAVMIGIAAGARLCAAPDNNTCTITLSELSADGTQTIEQTLLSHH